MVGPTVTSMRCIWHLPSQPWVRMITTKEVFR
jgi:hypothetical protein